MAEVKITVKNIVEGQGDLPKTAKNYERLNKGINTIAVSMGAVIAAGMTFKQAFDLSREGASINQIEESFALLNEQVLKTPGLLADMDAKAQGTIKQIDLMAGVLTLTAGQSDEMAQQFAAATPRLIEIAKAAQKLNPTLGDTAFLYQSLSTGIKRSSPLILDNLGIVVKIGEANKVYAEEIGKSVEELTAQEKQIALLNATMEAGGTLIDQVGGSVESQTDSWDRLTVKVGVATDSLKQNMAEGLEPWIKLVNGDYHEAIRQIEQDNLMAAEAVDNYTDAQTRTSEGQDAVIASIVRTSASYDEFISKLDAAGISIINVRTDMAGMNDVWFRNAREVEMAAQEVEQFNEQVARVSAQLERSTNNTIVELSENVSEARHQTLLFNDALQGVDPEAFIGGGKAAEEMRDNIRDAAIAERELRENARDAANEMERLKEASDFARQAEFASTFTAALDDQTAAFGRWVTTATVVGGRTEDQQENFDELASRAEKLNDNIRSLTGGTAGLGLSTDELNDKINKQREELALVEAAMMPLSGLTAEYSDVTQQWVVDADAMNQTLFDQITANTDNEIAITSAGIALGLYDETQIETALNAAIISEKINDLAESFVNGEITSGEMKEAMDEIVNDSPYTSEIEVITDAANAAIDKTHNKLKAIDGLTVKARIQVETTGSTSPVDDANVPNDPAPPPGAGAGAGGGSPTRAGGGSVLSNIPFIVGKAVPELFVPNTSGTIVPNNQLGGQNITISFAGAIFQGTTQQQAEQISTMVAQDLGR